MIRYPTIALAAITALVLLAGCQSAEPVTGPAAGPNEQSIGKGKPVCLPATLRVRADADPGGDGSAPRPFTSIRTALAAAEKQACEVRIQVADGVYNEAQGGALTINRPVTIEGLGTPTVLAPFEITAKGGPVVLQGMEISGIRGAAIHATGSALTLSFMHIADANGFGVVQEGGTLSAFALEISGTMSEEKNPAAGTALAIVGGTHANLFLVSLHDNVHGLYASDAGTTVNAVGLQVENTGFYPGLPVLIGSGTCAGIGFNHLGAVEFAAGAEGSGLGWNISGSAMVGLYTHDGGSVRVSGVNVSFATTVTGTGAHHDECGGFDVVAHRGGEVDITRIQITDAALCGVMVGGAPGTGVDLHNGFITRAPIGACVQQDGYDTERLHDHVEYRDVGIPLQATSYDLPDVIP